MRIETAEINKIQPAPYNPREISEEQFAKLQDSLLKVGFIIPIIINRQNGVIIAGHQRTKAAKAVGMETVPCFYIDNISLGDEIKFNQMHNGTDIYSHLPLRYYGEAHKCGTFSEVSHKEFEKNTNVANMRKINEMCKLILKYGNVFCAVVSGKEAILHTEYIKACQLLSLNANVYFLDESKREAACEFLRQDYGKYSYKSIERHTYVQGLAQMNRLGEDVKKENYSSLYETLAIPYLTKHKDATVFDFGCGKAAYVNKLGKLGYNISGLEFYNHNTKSIDVSKGNRMIDAFLRRIEKCRQFGVVVCDSVINSVDSTTTEFSVMATCNLLTKNKLFISGRDLGTTVNRMNGGQEGTFEVKRNTIYYLDDDNFSANYRKGHWFFQHFHSRQDVERLLTKYGFEIEVIGSKHTGCWQVEAHKVRDLSKEDWRRAIEIEFNLPLPFGKTYNRHKDALKVLENIGLL